MDTEEIERNYHFEITRLQVLRQAWLGRIARLEGLDREEAEQELDYWHTLLCRYHAGNRAFRKKLIAELE